MSLSLILYDLYCVNNVILIDTYNSRFNPQGQRLDIVELTAVFACLPAKFQKDPGNK